MKFKKPEVVKDYFEAIWQSAIVLEKVVHGAPISATEHFPQIWSNLKGKPEVNLENMAWTFLASCVSTALMTLLREPRMRCELTDQELTDHAKGLVDALPDVGDIRGTDLINLALAQCTKKCIQQASEVIAKAAPESGFKKDQLEQMYREALARSVTVVFQRQSDLFSGMVESITGPTAEPEMREIAWQRHGAWCRSLFCESPIFSPGNDIDIPLSHVYQKLRCYWNDEHKKECDGDGEPLQYRTATVGDLHDTIDTWLNKLKKDDAIRLIAGGPGSGKSSFATAFAAELIGRQTHRVLFVKLHGFQTAGDTLREIIGRHLKDNYGLKPPNKCEGFKENPLDWHGEDTRPLLMIFDGLDELTTHKDRESRLTKSFVGNLKHLLNELNGMTPTAAIVLGRDLAMNAALEDDDLRLECLIHVAPIRKMTRGDLQLDQNPSDDEIDDGFDPVIDPGDLIDEDTRKAYWDKWIRVQGMDQSNPPAVVHDERMSELNVEPLLLHLLIISDFCGDRWNEAADNRNLVYHNIFSKVFKRNKRKGLDAYKKLEQRHFFELMEVFGLAAFRGNGRTGDHEEFHRLRERYVASKAGKRIYSELNGAGLQNVALMIHSRREIEGAGFEFVHKSFGEYLAARALLGAADRLQRIWYNDDNSEGELQLALRWVEFVGTGELSNPVLRFLRDECRQWELHRIEKTIDALTAIFNNTLVHGFPVQKSDELSDPTYRHLEHRQKCAERAMLATITSLWLARNGNDKTGDTPLISLGQFESSRSAASVMINRLFFPSESKVRVDPTLSGLNLKGNDLYCFSIPFADLSGADLSGATLTEADLREACLNGADLSLANLNGIDLTRANLSGSDLSGASLKRVLLTGANLTSVNLSGAILTSVDLSGANLFDANIHIANLDRVNLSYANLNTAVLTGTCLTEADLSKTDLSDANLIKARLRYANLITANLNGAKLNKVDLTGADLSNAILSGADLRGADLTAANLENTDLTNCRIDSMSVRFVNFTKNVKLTQEQVNTFFGFKSGWGKTLLPDHLSPPDHWYTPESEAETESQAAINRYFNSWIIWQLSR